MGLALASLIQCFEWERNGEEEEVDLTEGTDLTMPKVKPLEALCKARECMLNVLSKLMGLILNCLPILCCNFSNICIMKFSFLTSN